MQTCLQPTQHIATVTERDRLLRLVSDEKPLNERTQSGYECVIGAMLQVIFGSSPAGRRYSVFESQEFLATAIIAHSGELFGISKRR